MAGMRETVVGMRVVNTPPIIDKPYVVVRWCQNKLWYYGQYKSEEDASKVAEELGNGLWAKVESVKEVID